jgi:hypothetical protein
MRRKSDFILLILGFVAFVWYIGEIDKYVNTEVLFPNTNSKLIIGIYSAVMGFITAGVADSKGRENIRGWFVFGALIPPLPLVLAMMLSSKPRKSLVGAKNCPNCGEILEADETRCLCGTRINRTSVRR